MRRFLLFITLAALVCASELEDNEQKKRGASKTTSLNAIPSGAQKPDYTYSIYSQSPSQTTTYQSQPAYQTQPASYQTQSASYQTQPATYQTHQPTTYQVQPSYQSQPSYQNQPNYQTQPVSNSFYPSQANQYYTAPSQSVQSYPQQPQISLIPPASHTFVPINFIPSPGYQTKYSVPAKPQNPVQYIVQQPVNSVSPYQNLFASNQPNQHFLNSLSPHSLVAPNFASLPFSSPYFSHPSMLLFGQPSSLFNGVLYQNPLQSLYNYYPNSQPKYVNQPSVEYDKVQSQVSQSESAKDGIGNDISQSTNPEYLAPQESVSYKNSYTRSSYSKH